MNISKLFSTSLTPEIIEAGLTDELAGVRFTFAERKDYTPTAAQVERGLLDEKPFVRQAFWLREDFKGTPHQIERGLTDVSEKVRWATILHAFKQDINLLSKQIERASKDDDAHVREVASWIVEAEIKKQCLATNSKTSGVNFKK